MNIFLSPVRSDASLTLEKSGNTITLNGEEFDFSRMNDGDFLPKRAIRSTWFTEDVKCVEGVLVLTLMLPLPANYSQEQAFPQPLLDVQEGKVFLPQPLTELSLSEGHAS
jgi:hypothetical protein